MWSRMQNAPARFGDLKQLFALGERRGHWLLDQYMLASQQCGFGHFKMQLHRGGNQYKIHLIRFNYCSVVLHKLGFRP